MLRQQTLRAEIIIRYVGAMLIGALYLWCVRATGEKFIWGYTLDEYYNKLAQGFTARHLHLPIEPAPALLALPDPWDASKNESLRAGDLVLYNRHYYLYQGVTPAIILFVPWRLLTATDVSERFGVWLFCSLGYLCSCGLFLRILKCLAVRPPPALLAMLILALGICQAVPFLLVRVYLYEVPIACGYLCVSGGFYCLMRGLEPECRSILWFACSGLLLSAAIGCRPDLGTAVVVVWLALYVRGIRARTVLGALYTRELMAFTIPAAACIFALGAYNYARFDNPLEFGLRYLMAGPTYFNVRPEVDNILPGCYYFLLCPPEFDIVFPYFRLGRQMLEGLPKRYFLEPIAGAISTWPMTLIAMAAPLLSSRWCTLLWSLYLAPVSCVIAISATGLVSHRFTVDFLPEFVLLGCVVVAVLAVRLRGVKRAVATSAFAVLVLYSMTVNLALGIQGPYDEMVQVFPARYVRLARYFSPVLEFRPILNPRLTVEAIFDYESMDKPGAKPLVIAGRAGSRYALYAESNAHGRVRLVSTTALTAGNTVSAEVPLIAEQAVRVRIEYSPRDRVMSIFWNDQTVIRHELPFLVTAPAQVRIGEDVRGAGGSLFRFWRRITVLERVVRPSS